MGPSMLPGARIEVKRLDTVNMQTANLDADGFDRRDLARRLRMVSRIGQRRALYLVAPLLIFLLVSFLIPIGLLLVRAVDNREISDVLPRTSAILRDWEGGDQIPSGAIEALSQDLRTADSGAVADVARRLNFYDPGLRSKIMKAAREASEESVDSVTALNSADSAWRSPEVWRTLKKASPKFTGYYFLRALDFDLDGDRKIVRASEPIYTDALWRTLGISSGVMIVCLLLAYPVAYLMASVGDRTARYLMVFVLLPFWTSLLVRTTAWLVLLQNNGVVNSFLQWTGITTEPLQLAYNRFGVFVAMTHILLPFAVLPIHAVMKGIAPSYVRAASSLGAPPWRAFLHIYLPLSLPGVGAGALLVFILALGYYITPTLVGGPRDQMLSTFVAFFVNQSTNWSMAAALASILLFIVAALYVILAIIVGRRSKSEAA